MHMFVYFYNFLRGNVRYRKKKVNHETIHRLQETVELNLSPFATYSKPEILYY